MKYKYIFFDVANTLLHKPDLYKKMNESFNKNQIFINYQNLKKQHLLFSEDYSFPDKTSKEFYKQFNTDFVSFLGYPPTDLLIDDIYENCKYLPWQPFEDTTEIKNICIPKGIISNWNSGLSQHIKMLFPSVFDHVFISEHLNLRKPDISFYKYAIDSISANANEVLYVGDSMKLDIIPALNIGIKAILIDRNSIFDDYKGEKVNSINQLNSFINF